MQRKGMPVLESESSQKIIDENENRLRRQRESIAKLAERRAVVQENLFVAFREITEIAAMGLNVQRASIWLYNEGRSAIHCFDLFELDEQRHSNGIALFVKRFPSYFKALEEEQAISASDVRGDERTAGLANSYLSQLGITSMLGIPIWVRGKIEGVVCFEHTGPVREWSVEEEHFARSITNFVSLAMETNHRMRAEEDMRKRADWAEGLQRAGEELAGTKKIKDLNRVAAHAPVKHLGLRMAWLSVPDEDGGMVPFVFSEPDIKEISDRCECSKQVYNAGRYIIVADTQKNPPFYGCRSKAMKEEFGSCATFPITIGDECIATLSVCDREAGGRSSVVQVAPLIEVFCRQIGYAWQRSLAEEELRIAKEAAEAASRIKSDFLANMSHELRTPLNSIIGFSEILTEKTFGPLEPKQERYVNNILTSGWHLLQLINDILDLSKIEAGKSELEPARLNLENLLESGLSIIKEKALKGKIMIDLRVSDQLKKFEITADERKLKQILFNLLSNAVKFTPAGGSICVQANLVSDFERWVSEMESNGKIVVDSSATHLTFSGQPAIEVSVVDSGIGIDPEDQERIFEDFEQIDSSYARKQKGTGLGLALSKRLVELHGGWLWVESEGQDKGCKFTFVIPAECHDLSRDDKAADAFALEEKIEIKSGKPLVLIVEDDRDASELLGQYVSEAGYEAVYAFNGEQAIQMAKKLKPHAITLDILLPKKDGFEVLNELKSFSGTKDIPVVVVSITEDRQLGFSMGAVEWFVKPVERDGIVEALNRIRSVSKKTDLTVLVVDDEPETVELLTDSLTSLNFRVLQAYGGKQGIHLAIERLPDVMILDLIMPQITGFDVVQSLREHPEAKDIPILVYTAKDITQKDYERLDSHVRTISSKLSGKQQLLGELEKLEKQIMAS